MNSQQISLLLSILLHGIVGGSIYVMSITFAHPVKTIVIDLTVSPEGLQDKESPANSVNSALRKIEGRWKPALGKSRSIVQSGNLEAQEKVTVRAPAHPTESASKKGVPAAGPEGPTSPSGPASSGTPLGSNRPGETTIDGFSVAGGGTGSQGDSPEQLRNGYLKEHFAYIKDIIQRSISYPPKARRMGWTGRVVVSFVIDEHGWTFNEKILESSGFEVLDRNVIETVKTVSPFPKPPVKAELRIPINYRLE
jgi:protein TonB